MEKEFNQVEQLIIPTQEIAFAVLKDGSVISSYSRNEKENDGTIVIDIFEALINEVKKANKSVLFGYAMSGMVLVPKFMEAIKNRVSEQDEEEK